MSRLALTTSICLPALAACLGLGVVGCDGTYRRPTPADESVGHWVNRYPGSTTLLGIKVQQFPDTLVGARPYEGRHPARVTYVFKDGRVNQINYTPDGKIVEDGDIWFRLAPGDPLWTNLDPPPK